MLVCSWDFLIYSVWCLENLSLVSIWLYTLDHVDHFDLFTTPTIKWKPGFTDLPWRFAQQLWFPVLIWFVLFRLCTTINNQTCIKWRFDVILVKMSTSDIGMNGHGSSFGYRLVRFFFPRWNPPLPSIYDTLISPWYNNRYLLQKWYLDTG